MTTCVLFQPRPLYAPAPSPSPHHPITPSPHHPITPSTHQPINPSTHQPTSPPAHQPTCRHPSISPTLRQPVASPPHLESTCKCNTPSPLRCCHGTAPNLDPPQPCRASHHHVPQSPYTMAAGQHSEPPNVLLCQFLPNKGMDLSAISRTRLNDIARLVNGGPRLVLDAHLLTKTRRRFLKATPGSLLLHLTLEIALLQPSMSGTVPPPRPDRACPATCLLTGLGACAERLRPRDTLPGMCGTGLRTH